MYVCLNLHDKRCLIGVRTVCALSKLWSKYYFLNEAAAEACEMVIKVVIHITELQVYHLPMWRETMDGAMHYPQHVMWRETTDGAMHYPQHVMTGLHSYRRSVILSLCAFVVGVFLFFAVAFVVGVLLFFAVAFVVLARTDCWAVGFCLNSIFGY